MINGFLAAFVALFFGEKELKKLKRKLAEQVYLERLFIVS